MTAPTMEDLNEMMHSFVAEVRRLVLQFAAELIRLTRQFLAQVGHRAWRQFGGAR